MNLKHLEKEDNEIKMLIDEELKRQQNTLEMIASENIVSEAVLEAAGSVLTNKYAEGYPKKRYYGGCEIVDKIEQLAIDRACKLFGCKHANVQPHSGSQANFAVYMAFCKPGDTILTLDLSNYSHLTHGSPVNFSGKLFDIETYKIRDDGYIDMEDFEKRLYEVHPKMVITGTSAYPREIDFAKYREIIDKYNENAKEKCLLWTDMAHIAGLVATGMHQSPIPYADVVTTTTHKTLRGIRGGLILWNNDEYTKPINSAVFPTSQGGGLQHIIAAKAVGFKEAMQSDFKDYISTVVTNSKKLAETLTSRGFNLVTGGTDNHLILIDLRNKGITGKAAQDRLENFGIAVNKNAVPNETEKPMITSGIRLGTAAITTRGMKEAEMVKIGNYIADILSAPESELGKLEYIKEEIRALLGLFPIYE